jgi:hypothetical protein
MHEEEFGFIDRSCSSSQQKSMPLDIAVFIELGFPIKHYTEDVSCPLPFTPKIRMMKKASQKG